MLSTCLALRVFFSLLIASCTLSKDAIVSLVFFAAVIQLISAWEYDGECYLCTKFMCLFLHFLEKEFTSLYLYKPFCLSEREIKISSFPVENCKSRRGI